MDYHSLKRKELQALCKEHHIPANSANSVLADKLSALLNEKQKPGTRQRGSMKTTIESTAEGEPAALKRQAKKVRFSPTNDFVEYELRSGEKQKDTVTPIKTRRQSLAKKVDKPVVDNNTSVELVDDSAQIPVKLTRSRGQLSVKDGVVLNNETNLTTRATRAKVQTLMEGGTVPAVKSHVRKKSGKQVETDEKIVEPSKEVDVPVRATRSGRQTLKEVMDVPVRATRSGKQTLKEDIVNVDTNSQVDKKRTRRQMKATDSPLDKKEPLKRKSARTREVEEEAVDEGDKVVRDSRVTWAKAPLAMEVKEPPKRKTSRDKGVEAVDEGDRVVRDVRVTRAKAPLAIEVTGRTSRSKANKVGIQQLEEPSKHASKKNESRKNSVLQAEKTEVIIPLEEPVNRPVRKNTRRNSVMPEATKMVKVPVVGKKQSKGQSGKLSTIKGQEVEERVFGPGKDAPEEGFREASVGSHTSRKRRATPIIDDQTIEIKYASPVDKSPKSSTPSDMKSEEKTVTKLQADSSSKKSISRTNNQSSVGNISKGKSWEVGSGSLIRDGSSRKRAKISGTKQNDSEYHDGISSKEASPVAKTGTLKLGVTQPEVTPSTDKSHKRFTRSALGSGGVTRDGSSKKSGNISGTKQDGSEHQDGVSSKEATPVAKTGKSKLDDGVTQSEVTPATVKSHMRITRSAIRSGTVIRDGSSKRRAKLSGIKQNDSEHYDVISSKAATPVVKTGNIKLDKGVTQPEDTPSIDKSHRRFTRSAIGSERKDPGQSAIKELPFVGSQFSSAKVAKFRHDPAVNTAPGRVLRGTKHEGNEAGSFSEKIDKKKQKGHAAHKKQSLDDAQMASPDIMEVVSNPEVVAEGVSSETEQPLGEAPIFSPEVAEVGSNTDVDTIGVLPEYKETYVDVQMSSPEVAEVFANPDRGTVEDGSEKPASESVCLPTNHVENRDPVSEYREPDVDTIGVLPEYNEPYVDVQMPSPEVAEVFANPDSGTVEDGSEKPASESVSLPTNHVENRDPVSGTSADMDSASPVSGGNASGEVMEDADAHAEKLTYAASATPSVTENMLSGKQQKPLELQSFDDVTPSGKFSQIRMTSVSMADISKTVHDAVSDGSHVESRIFSDAVTLETSIFESGRPDAKEKETELTESGSTSKGLQTDVKIDEPPVSDVKAVVMEESVDIHISSLGISTKGNNVDESNCDSISYNVGSSAVLHASIQQSDAADDGEQYDEDESAKAQKPLMPEAVSEDRSVADGVEAQETDSLAGGCDDVPNIDNSLDQSTVNIKLHELDVEDAVDTVMQPAKEPELEVVPSTHNDIHDNPNYGKSAGEDGSSDAAKESEMGSTPSHACNMIQDPSLSGKDEGDATNTERESNPNPVPDIDAYDASPMDKDDVSVDRQPEPILEPSSATDVTVIPFSGNNVYCERDNAPIADQKSHLDMFETLVIDKGDVPDDGNNAPKELETASELSNVNNLDDNSNAQDVEPVHDQLTSSANLAVDEEDVGGDEFDSNAQDVESVHAQLTSSDNLAIDEEGVGGDDFDSNAQDVETVHDQLTSSDNLAVDEDGVGGDDFDSNAQDVGTVPDQLTSNDNLAVDEEDVGGDDFDSNAQDVESVHDQLTDNDNLANNEEDVGGDDFDTPPTESIPVAAEVPDRSCDQEPENKLSASVYLDTVGQSDFVTNKVSPETPAAGENDDMVVGVDALEESVLDISKDAVSSILGDIYDMDADDDHANEKGSTESGEGFQPKEIRGVSSITRESLPITYEKEEAPVDDTDSDLPTVKEDDKNKQEETPNADTSIDWGEYNIGFDELQNPVSADGSVDVVGKGKKDDQDSDIQASDRTSSSTEESSGFEAGLSSSVRNFEENSPNVADRKCNQEVDILKESAKTADVTQEVFDRSDADSSLKQLDSAPVATRVSCVKASQENAVNLASQDTYSSCKVFDKTPAVPQFSHVKDGHRDAFSSANQDPYSSLRSLFATPSTTQISHVEGAQISHVEGGRMHAASLASQDPYSSLKSFFTTPAPSRMDHANNSKADLDHFAFPTHRSHEDAVATETAVPEFHRQWEHDHSKVLDGEAHGSAVQDFEKEMHGDQSFEEYSLELFGEGEVGGSFDETSGANKHFEFKDDQVDEIEDSNISTEAAGTSRLDPSGLKDNPLHGGEFENKEETPMKGSETDDSLALDTGK